MNTKALFCKLCSCIFTLDNSKKKCDCKKSSGYLLDGRAFYSGDHCVVISVSAGDLDIFLTKFSDETASKSDKKKKPETTGPEKEFCIKVMEYLNRRAATNYSTKFPSSATDLILARKKEHNCTLQDFIVIIDNKSAEWMGTAQQIYLRPMTLFNKQKFINYLGQNGSIQKPASTFQKFADTVQSAKGNIPEGSNGSN